MQQNTNRTKCINSKIQTRQNTKRQNTNCQIENVTKKTNATKYKCKKRTKYKNDKIEKKKI